VLRKTYRMAKIIAAYEGVPMGQLYHDLLVERAKELNVPID